MASRHSIGNPPPPRVLGVVGGEEVFGDRDSWEARAEELFTLCDREVKGFVTKRDMQRLWGEMPLSPDEFEAVFDSLDEDHNGFLSLEEFTDGFGRHLGLAVQFEAETTSAVNSVPCHEDKLNTDVLLCGENLEQTQCDLAQEHITTLIDNLLSVNQDSGSSEAIELWHQLSEGLELSSDSPTVDIESLVTALLREMLRVRSEHFQLEATLRTKTEQFTQEVSRLHAEIDAQLALVHRNSKVETEQQLRDKRRINLLQQQIDDRETAIKTLEEELNKIRKDLQVTSDREGQVKQENSTLKLQVDHFEEELRHQENELKHVTSALMANRRASKDDKKNRFKQALQVSEGIARERESLVEQLDLLRNINLQLKDSSDLNAMPTSPNAGHTIELASDFDWSVSSPSAVSSVDDGIELKPQQEQTPISQLVQPRKSPLDLEHDDDYFKKEALSYIQDWNMIDTSSEILNEITKDFSCVKKKAEDFCENVYALLRETDIEKTNASEEIPEDPHLLPTLPEEEAKHGERSLLQELLPQLPLCAACGGNLSQGENKKRGQREENIEICTYNTTIDKETSTGQNIEREEKKGKFEEDMHIEMKDQKEEMNKLDEQINKGKYKLLRKEDINHLCICKRSIGFGRQYHSSLLIFLPSNGKCNHNCPQHGKQQICYKYPNEPTELQDTKSTFTDTIISNALTVNILDNNKMFDISNFNKNSKTTADNCIQTENNYHLILKKHPDSEMHNANMEELIAKYTEGEYIDSEIYKIQDEYKLLLEMNGIMTQFIDTAVQTEEFNCKQCIQKETEMCKDSNKTWALSDIYAKNMYQSLIKRDISNSAEFVKNNVIIQQKNFKNEYFREVATFSQNSPPEKLWNRKSSLYDMNHHKKLNSSYQRNKLLSTNDKEINESVTNHLKDGDVNVNSSCCKTVKFVNEKISSNVLESSLKTKDIGKDDILHWPVGSTRLTGSIEENSNTFISSKPRMFKVVFLGDSGVGKTCFIHRSNTQEYRSDFAATVGVDYQNVSVHVGGTEVRMQLWDTAGQERFKAITKQYYSKETWWGLPGSPKWKADGVVVMYDITSERSFLNVADWISQVKETCGEVVVAVVGNKSDLSVGRRVSKDTAFILAKQYECLVYEASAATGGGVLEVLKHLAALLTNNQEHQLATSTSLSLHRQPPPHRHTKKKCC